ncbi:MAG: ABC transporter substrate-binding protein [Anaerolineae bacterium]|nr:MAG: ABC transporter substrate-binding protein [Anaerolineae bacterium]
MFKKLLAVCLLLGLVLSIAPITTAQDTVTVRVAMTPFFDYQFFSVADEFGWDEELGIDLEFTWLTQSGPSVQALASGSVDTVNTCVVCNFPFYESVPELRNFLTVNQFKGFVVIGRVGQAKTYQEFLDELGDPVAATTATIEQFEGATWPMYSANYEPLLRATLDQGGLTIDDVEIINFPDDEKAALAMIGGTGDFYIGGLPSEINLLSNHPDEFVLIGGAEILGPAGLWYSQVASNEEWLADNEDAALKIMAMSYRYNRYIQEARDQVLPIVVEAMNAHSGVGTTEEELNFIFDTFLDFRTYQQDQETTYNPDSPLYWEQSAKYYVEQSQDLPDDADYLINNPLNEWFDKFLEREDLLEWVDAPLE